MIADLKVIWKESFADPDWYINFFFDRRFEAENTLVYLDGDKPVSMFFMLPAQINIDGTYKNARYIYGVSTLPKYQGRGYSTALLKYANDTLLSSTDNMPDGVSSTFLTPASSSLFDFYKKQDYKNAFLVKEIDLTIKDLAKIDPTGFDFKNVDAIKYAAIRNKAFDCHGYVKWDEKALEYMLAENELLGGKAYVIQDDDSQNIIFYRVWDKKFFVKETTLDGNALMAVLKKVMENENVSECNVRLHSKSQINGQISPFAMIYGCEKVKDGYFNLALD